MNPFKAGDLVRLKSGSNRMVVASVIDGVAEVIWSDFLTKKVQRETLPITTLEVAHGSHA